MTQAARHMVFVLLREPVELDPQSIEQALFSACLGMKVTLLPGKAAPNVLLLDIAGIVLTVMNVGQPLPAGWEPAAKRAEATWAEAGAVFAQHRAHLVVTTMANDVNPLQAARLITAVIGAILESYAACTAVLWNSVAARPRALFLKGATAALAVYPDFPFPLWVDMQLFGDSENNGTVALTFGVRNFVGREIEMAAGTRDLPALLDKTRGFTVYLLQHGGVVKNGDTIGISARERIRVVAMESKRFFGLPVFAASLEAVAQ